MFGRNKKNDDKIKVLEDRLTALAQKVEENNHDIGELRGSTQSISSIEAHINGLEAVIAELQRRQNDLRAALVRGLEPND